MVFFYLTSPGHAQHQPQTQAASPHQVHLLFMHLELEVSYPTSTLPWASLSSFDACVRGNTWVPWTALFQGSSPAHPGGSLLEITTVSCLLSRDGHLSQGPLCTLATFLTSVVPPYLPLIRRPQPCECPGRGCVILLW